MQEFLNRAPPNVSANANSSSLTTHHLIRAIISHVDTSFFSTYDRLWIGVLGGGGNVYRSYAQRSILRLLRFSCTWKGCKFRMCLLVAHGECPLRIPRRSFPRASIKTGASPCLCEWRGRRELGGADWAGHFAIAGRKAHRLCGCIVFSKTDVGIAP